MAILWILKPEYKASVQEVKEKNHSVNMGYVFCDLHIHRTSSNNKAMIEGQFYYITQYHKGLGKTTTLSIAVLPIAESEVHVLEDSSSAGASAHNPLLTGDNFSASTTGFVLRSLPTASAVSPTLVLEKYFRRARGQL
ncbi:hypothetical protein H112_06885 [Trichophyton rubrum D6]|nr:hypothetical protein H112_06885 [Trichophyton rubrum D6]